MLSRLFSRPRQEHARPVTRRAPLRVEALENRNLMAAVLGLDQNNHLYDIDLLNPQANLSPIAITGFQLPSETVLGITFQPSTGVLYAVTATNGSQGDTSVRTYTLNPSNGALTYVGVASNLSQVGLHPSVVSFDPTTNQIRLVQESNSSNVNLRLNPKNGKLIATDKGLTYSAPLQGPISVGGYSPNGTLYEISQPDDALATQNGNGGVVSSVGSLGVNFIGNVDAFTTDSDSTALAILETSEVGDADGLYSINLSTGAATELGVISNTLNGQQLQSLAVYEPSTAPAAAPPVVVVGANTGGVIQILNPQTGAVESTFQPFPGFLGAIKVAASGDGSGDIAVAAVFPQGPVKVLNQTTLAQVLSIYAFPGFAGTVNIAMGDVTGGATDDVIVVANGSNGALKAFNEQTGAVDTSFLAFPGFKGDVTVAAGDLGATGTDQIVAVAAHNGNIRAFNENGSLYSSSTLPGFTFNFDTFTGFNGDVSVALGDLTGNGYADLIIGSGAGSRGEIRVYDGESGDTLGDFFAFPAFTKYGVNVAAANVSGSAEGGGPFDLVSTPASSATPTDVTYYGSGGNPLGVMYPVFTNYAGGASIAASNL